MYPTNSSSLKWFNHRIMWLNYSDWMTKRQCRPQPDAPSIYHMSHITRNVSTGTPDQARLKHIIPPKQRTTKVPIWRNFSGSSGLYPAMLLQFRHFVHITCWITFNKRWQKAKTAAYLDDLLNIDNTYFDGMVKQIYPSELQLNKANSSNTETPFLNLHLTISYGFVSSKIYDKSDDFDFDIVNFPFLDGDIPRASFYGVYISQLIRFARVADFNTRKQI